MISCPSEVTPTSFHTIVLLPSALAMVEVGALSGLLIVTFEGKVTERSVSMPPSRASIVGSQISTHVVVSKGGEATPASLIQVPSGRSLDRSSCTALRTSGDCGEGSR